MALTYRALSGQLEASRWVYETNAVIRLVTRIDDDLGAILTGLGSYLLLGEPGAIRGAESACRAALDDLRGLEAMVQGDAGQLERVRGLARAIEALHRDRILPLLAAVDAGDGAETRRLATDAWLAIRTLNEQESQLVSVERARLRRLTAEHAAAQRWTVLVLLLGGLAAVATSAAAAFVFATRLARPLEELTDSARAVAAGDMTRRVAVGSGDEVGTLGVAFNTMVAQVTERQALLERLRQEAEALLAIARVVGGTRDLQEALRLMCRELAGLTGADTVAAYVLDPPGRALRPVAGYHVPKDIVERLMALDISLADQGFRDDVLRRGDPVWTDDVAGDPRFSHEVFHRFRHQACLMLPLVLDEPSEAPGTNATAVSGAFYLAWWSAARRFEAAELSILQTVGRQVGVLLRNARLNEALGARAAQAELHARRLETLARLARTITSSMDPDAILPVLAEAACSLFPGAASRVWLVEGSVARLAAEAGVRDTGEGAQRTLRLGEGVIGRVCATGEPMVLDDAYAAPELVNAEWLRAQGVVSMAALPLAVGAATAGAFVVLARQRHHFAGPELALLQALAEQTTVVLEKARLYAEAQRNLAGATLLNEAARTLHRTLEVRRRLPAALEALGRTFGAFSVGFAASDDPATSIDEDLLVTGGAWTAEGMKAVAALVRHREEPLLVADLESDAAPPACDVRPAGARALAVFAVRGRGRVGGALALAFAVRRALSPVEVRLLSAYADQLAMALDNAALFEDAERQKTQLEHIFASTSDGLLSLDRRQRIAALNRQGADLLGVLPGEMAGRLVHHLLRALEARAGGEPAGAAGLREALVGPPGDAAGDLDLPGPPPRTLRWQATPTLDAAGTAVGVTVTLRDVTREREVDRMKTEFVSTVSHELRTPLTSIKGSLHLLLAEAEGPGDATRRQLLDICLSNTERLIRLINDILDVSKMEAGRMELQIGRRRVGEFVAEAVEGIRAFAASRGVGLETRVPEDLPEVPADFDRMVRVMTNLLSNAIKFSAPAGRVLVTATRVPAGVEIRVIDQGRGIAPADLPRLFQKFQQLDGRMVREVGGTGLGLAICKSIVEEHGGVIRVESEVGRGATFVVTLPAAEAAAPARVR